MQIQKSQKLLLVVIVIFVIVTFLSTFILTGCGRRARAIAAMENAGQTEEQKDVSRTENVNENGKTDSEETAGESTEKEASTETEETTKIDESAGNEDNDTAETEETTVVEETTQDEETSTSENTEETDGLDAKIAANMPFVKAECANIYGGNPHYESLMFVGDNGLDNLEVRGFISFDISQLAGAAIESAKISGQSSNLQGTPIATYGPMIIKAVYWGARAVTIEDFNLDGIEITNNSKTNFNKSPAVLKDDLQNVVNGGINRYQLCFYFEMPQTDGDGESDCISYPLENIILTVTYTK